MRTEVEGVGAWSESETSCWASGEKMFEWRDAVLRDRVLRRFVKVVWGLEVELR